MYVSLQANRSIIYTTYIKKNSITLEDDWFGLVNSEESDYFYQRSSNEYFTSDDEFGPGKGRYFV
jgi:hypothetical protein